MEISLAAEAALLAACLALTAATAHLIIHSPTHWRGFCIFSAFALTYLGTLAATMFGISWTFLDPRYLTPLCLPILLMLAFAADNLLRRCKAKERTGIMRHSAKFALLAPLCLWLGYSAALQAGQIRRGLVDGPERSLTNSKWSRSHTVQYMREISWKGTIYSNFILPLYIHSNPTNEYVQWTQNNFRLRRLSENAEGSAYVVWFYDSGWAGATFHYNDFHLRALPNTEIAAEFSDGLILRLKPSARFDKDAYQAGQSERANAIINSAGRAAIRSKFNVHVNQRTLTYIKAPCAKADTTAKFFLHIRPTARHDLPLHHRRYGYDNLDFEFVQRGFQFAGRCVARINLPEYPIASITTGQFSREGQIWKGKIDFR